MRRRSLIITVFCLGEIVFAIQLIIQAELVKSEVKEWNRIRGRIPNDTKTRLKCPSNDTCCRQNQTDIDSMEKAYRAFISSGRDAKYLEPILFPLIVIVGSNCLAALMFNSGTFDFIKVIAKIKYFNETFIRRMSFMFWCICWLAEIGIGGFVATMSALAMTHLLPSRLRSHEYCKNSGQSISDDKLELVKCFRKLKVCPTAEEQTLIASLLLSFFLIICAVFKIGYRFFLQDDDTERFECPNCCRCSKKETTKNPALLILDGGDPGSAMNSVETIQVKPDAIPATNAVSTTTNKVQT